MCGISSLPPPEISKEEKAKMEAKMTNIKEDPKWGMFATANAVLLIGVGVFVFAYFG